MDSRPKHKPNEKHTLDEVLKSLQDLVRGNVLVRTAAAPTANAKSAPPAPPMADMSDIISSLESLLESDLNLEEKVERAKAALAPVRKGPAAPKPIPAAPAPKPAPTVAAPAPVATKPAAPAKPVAPPPPPPPMLETEDELVFESDAAPAETPEPLAFPEEMSDEDIANALADIQFDVDAAPAPEAEPEIVEAAPAPEPETIAVEAAPPPTLEFTDDELAELTQKASKPKEPKRPEKTPPRKLELAIVEGDLSAAPAPAKPTSLDDELAAIDFTSDATAAPAEPAAADDFEIIDLSNGVPTPSTDEIPMEAAPAPVADDFSVDFKPKKKPPAAPEPEPDDLAPPPWEEDDIQRAEPPTPTGEVSPGGLGESIELDLSISGAEEFTTPVFETDDIDLAPAPDTEIIAPPPPPEPTVLAPAPKPKPPKPAAAKPSPKDIPVLKNVAQAAPAQATPPPAPPSPPAAPAPDDFTLDFAPTTPAKPAAMPQDLNQMAVRVIAKLNIEMRKAGKPPLDAKTINRLQQLLREALEKKQ
jgi:hypothetical protein